HLLAPIRKEAQETFFAVVTDGNGKVLRVMRHSKGTKDGSAVYPLDVVAEAASIEGAATIHYGHNHPSGIPEPSADDERITNHLNEMLDGTGITPGYHVVIGSEEWRGVASDSDPRRRGGDLEPRARKVSVPVTERRITRRGTVLGGAPV